jgi:hypothetical protein
MITPKIPVTILSPKPILLFFCVVGFLRFGALRLGFLDIRGPPARRILLKPS